MLEKTRSSKWFSLRGKKGPPPGEAAPAIFSPHPIPPGADAGSYGPAAVREDGWTGSNSSPEQDLIQCNEVKVERRGGDWLPYLGLNKLVIGIDIGTTYSGASFCVLERGKKPTVQDVTSYKGQGTGHSKIASVIVYDTERNPVIFGDTAATAENLTEGFSKARCWKLHMKPAHLKLFASEHNVLEPLPANIPVAKILQDFLRFMVQSTKDFIADRVPDGGHLVANLANRTEYILTIPNGWEVEQQEMIRKCCIAAGLVTQERAKRYIHFLHEAEASINYCAAKMSEADWINEIGKRVLIVDAGGGTVDITSYRVQETEPKLMVKETSASECLLVGSATIDRQFRKYLERRLSGSKLDNSDDLAHYQRDFSTGIKTQFAGVDRDYLLKCGPATLESSSLGIERGRLKLKGTDISSMFEHSVVKTVAAVMNQVSRDSANEVTVAAMVGGFSESEYFRTEVRKRLGTAVKVCKPDGATAKAVAHGAVAWFLDGCVTSRIAKYDYGVRCSVRYDPSLETHRAKESDCQALASSGHKMLTHAFGTILKRGQESSDDETISEKYQVSWSTEESLVKNVVIYAYRGEDEHAPEFLSEGPFDHLVTFSIDLEPFRSMLPVATGPTGAKYIRLPLHLAMRLNGTQVAATAGFEVGGKRYTKEAVLILDKLSS